MPPLRPINFCCISLLLVYSSIDFARACLLACVLLIFDLCVQLAQILERINSTRLHTQTHTHSCLSTIKSFICWMLIEKLNKTILDLIHTRIRIYMQWFYFQLENPSIALMCAPNGDVCHLEMLESCLRLRASTCDRCIIDGDMQYSISTRDIWMANEGTNQIYISIQTIRIELSQ